MHQTQRHLTTQLLAGLFAVAVFSIHDEARAQTTGEIVGTVTDASTQKIVSGASVEIVSSAGTHRATTNRDGFYAFVDAFPNAYVVMVSAPGYGTAQEFGGSVNPGQTLVVDVQLQQTDTRLAAASAAAALSIVSPNVTLDQFVLTAAATDATNGSGGSYGLYQTPGIIGTLPGVTLDAGVNAHVRGSRLNEVGYTYDGVNVVDPITGLPATNLVEDGIVRLQVTDGGDVASGPPAMGGAVNSVVGVGSYPEHGSVTLFEQAPTYYHGTNFQYGDATPDNRLSWFASGILWNSGYDWGARGSFVPGADSFETAYGDGPVGAAAPSRDQVVNVHYRLGAADDIQLLAATGFERFDNALDARYWPSTNPDHAVSTNPSPTNGLCDNNGLALFPGQPACTSPTGSTTDHIDQNFGVEKIQFTHDLTASSSLALAVAGVTTAVDAYYPFGDGPFADLWSQRLSTQRQATAEYMSQIDERNLIDAGVSSDWSDNHYVQEFVSSGYGLVTPTNTGDFTSWLSDEFRASSRLEIQGEVASVSRTFDRVEAPVFSESAAQAQAAGAYTFGDGTILRASFGDHVELPFASQVERIETSAPNFGDISAADRAFEAQPAAAQSHNLDVSLERPVARGLQARVTPFWRQSSGEIVMPDVVTSTPQSIGRYVVHGIEIDALMLHAGAGISGYIDYTHTRALASGTGDFNAPVGAGALAAKALFPVAFIPVDAANAVLTWHQRKWTLNPEINFSGGYPYGVGRFTYNNLNCSVGGATTGGDPTRPCGAIVRNPVAYRDPTGGNCAPGACTQLLDPAESPFADGRICCSSITANLNIGYSISSRTQVGLQWQNLNRNYRPLALASNPYYPQSPYGPPGFNGYFNYGAAPYIPVALNNSEEFLFMLTQRL